MRCGVKSEFDSTIPARKLKHFQAKIFDCWIKKKKVIKGRRERISGFSHFPFQSFPLGYLWVKVMWTPIQLTSFPIAMAVSSSSEIFLDHLGELFTIFQKLNEKQKLMKLKNWRIKLSNE
jgi:hypothetical protein